MTADDVRALMAADPDFLALADQLRSRFGAKLIWVKVGNVEFGKRVATFEPGSRP
jgi:hypothetical protein